MYQLVRLIVAVAAAALLVVPAAGAYRDAGGGGGELSPAAEVALGIGLNGVSPDDRAASRGNPLTQLRQAEENQTGPSVSPDDRAYSRSTGPISLPTVVVHDNGGYRWLHAGEGAAAGFGFALILAALAALIIRSRRTVPAI